MNPRHEGPSKLNTRNLHPEGFMVVWPHSFASSQWSSKSCQFLSNAVPTFLYPLHTPPAATPAQGPNQFLAGPLTPVFPTQSTKNSPQMDFVTMHHTPSPLSSPRPPSHFSLTPPLPPTRIKTPFSPPHICEFPSFS